MELHPKYIKMLREVLDDIQFQAIMEAYEQEPVRGLRFNTDKPCDNPFEGETSRVNPDIFIPKHYAATVTHPFHHAGCYYIQDPSATIPVLALDLQADDTVIDLCAAPGGKSSYILNQIPDGFLIANEIDGKRNQKLVNNLLRWGHENVVVTQEALDKIAKQHKNTFNKVLLDAPCSGEGMYRRKPDFALEYREETAFEFASLQKELLESAYELVGNQGIIVYATCTLNTIENEEVVKAFLEKHDDVSLVPFQNEFGIVGQEGIGLRFIPSEHGEGQYLAKLQVSKDTVKTELKFKESPDTLDNISANFKTRHDMVYALKNRGFLKTKLNVTMDGVPFGQLKGKTWDYHHALSQSIAFKGQLNTINLNLDEAYRYLYGHTLEFKGKGIHCVDYANNSLGFIKGTGTHGNNRYPKSLRNKFDTYQNQ